MIDINFFKFNKSLAISLLTSILFKLYYNLKSLFINNNFLVIIKSEIILFIKYAFLLYLKQTFGYVKDKGTRSKLFILFLMSFIQVLKRSDIKVF